MNIRKNIDYSEMYVAINSAMGKNLSRMELYYAIGQAVSTRIEKGAAVMAAEYITSRYPDARGFSPRNVRRMRDFYRTYNNHHVLLSWAMQIGWTQNVVIMEANLTMGLREWYVNAVMQFGWSKAELLEKIANNAHEVIGLAIDEEMRHRGEQKEVTTLNLVGNIFCKKDIIRPLTPKIKGRIICEKGSRRRWPIMVYPKSMGRQIAFCDVREGSIKVMAIHIYIGQTI